MLAELEAGSRRARSDCGIADLHKPATARWQLPPASALNDKARLKQRSTFPRIG